MQHHRHARQSVDRARELRAHMTDAEQKLWHRLREFKHIGYHFRRQAPFEIYYLDFVEHAAKLVVELDGCQHGMQDQAHKDQARDAFLRSRDYSVLRFWNSELAYNLDGVVETILRELSARYPHPKRSALRPPRKGEVRKSRPLPRQNLRGP